MSIAILHFASPTEFFECGWLCRKTPSCPKTRRLFQKLRVLPGNRLRLDPRTAGRRLAGMLPKQELPVSRPTRRNEQQSAHLSTSVRLPRRKGPVHAQDILHECHRTRFIVTAGVANKRPDVPCLKPGACFAAAKGPRPGRNYRLLPRSRGQRTPPFHGFQPRIELLFFDGKGAANTVLFGGDLLLPES